MDLLPLLREFDPEKPYVEIRIEDMAEIRRIAFLRGHIPYLPQRLARLIGKGPWKRAEKYPNFRPEYFQGNMPKMLVMSCDFVCSMLDPVVHGDVYANGRIGGGRGFNRESIFELAADRGIVISSIPQHPLERNVSILPLAECGRPNEVVNDLPPPPPFIDNPTMRDFPLAKENIRKQREGDGQTLSDNTFNNIIARLTSDAREKIYRVGKQAMNRLEMMMYIPWAISEGKTRREICKGINGTPSMMEIAKWESLYPDFKESLRLAELVQAHTFMDLAHEIVMEVGADKDEIARAKLQSNFLAKRAALQNENFRDKQVIQTENLNEKNEMELKKTLKMLLLGNPDAVSDFIDITPIREEVADEQ